jgi:hypothetical protein
MSTTPPQPGRTPPYLLVRSTLSVQLAELEAHKAAGVGGDTLADVNDHLRAAIDGLLKLTAKGADSSGG